MIEKNIKKEIKKVLDSLNIKIENIHLEHPTDISKGDFATNVAMVGAKVSKQNPKELAEKIVEELEKNKIDEIEKIEIAGPGFINFFLSKKYFSNNLAKAIKEEGDWGKNEINKGKKIMVEYTQPNPFKAMHVGHLMSNTLGEAISRLIEYSGADTKRANYQGDIGPHVAKAIWGLQNNIGSLESATDIGIAYAGGTKAYEEKKDEIDLINKELYLGESDKGTNDLYDQGKKVSLEHFEEIYKKLGTKFDYYFFESDAWKIGIDLVKKNTPKIFEESDGAVIFHGENFDKKLHTRVFVTSDGLPTYETKELGLVKLKEKEFDFDISITVTANEQTEYFKVIKCAMEQVYPEVADKIIHVEHGILKLETGKMSSREGDVVTAETFIEKVENDALKVIKEREIENKIDVAEKVAIGAIKYSVLKQASGKDIIYDTKKALSFEGDSGPYLQYSHTRATSLLEKGGNNIKTESNKNEIILVEKLISRFPEVVEHAVKELQPHYVTTYLTELASAFNSFYASEKIIGSDDEEYKLSITKAFQNTIKNGLYLLGIKIPEKM